MEYTDKEFCLEVWGDRACFTRPELKVERVSYDVITPSAARAIFEAVFWKPAFRWEVTKIEVLNPIKWDEVRRNEVGALARPNTTLYIEEKRQQRNAIILRDVRYRIYAKLVYIPVAERDKQLMAHNPGNDENPMKYYEMFRRRAENGQCFTQPYLGTREFSAFFRLVDLDDSGMPLPIDESRDLGIMLYDMDFNHPAKDKSIPAMFFRAQMDHGVVMVPQSNSEKILR